MEQRIKDGMCRIADKLEKLNEPHILSSIRVICVALRDDNWLSAKQIAMADWSNIQSYPDLKSYVSEVFLIK